MRQSVPPSNTRPRALVMWSVSISSNEGSMPVRRKQTARFFKTKMLSSVLMIPSIFPPSTLLAEDLPSGHHPQVCLGYNAEAKVWGPIDLGSSESCPPHSAYFSANDPSDEIGAQLEPVGDPCCKLPAEDILLPARISAKEICPEDSVMVGTMTAWSKRAFRGTVLLCQFINSERYSLSPPEGGRYWGIGSETPNSLFDEKQIVWRELPLGVRYSVGRRGMTFWDADGCIADSPGALLSGKGLGNCRNSLFRRLLFRGLPGDPARGTAVRMFSNPTTISDIFDESSANSSH